MWEDTDGQSVESNDRKSHSEERTRRSLLQTVGAGASALALGVGATSPASAAKAEETCASGEVIEVANSNWHVLNNKWGDPDATQCIWRHDDGRYGWDSDSTGAGINYPQTFCGGRPWGSDSGISELPTQRSNISEFELEWDISLNESGGDWNLAEEWWLLDGQPQANNPPIKYEVMLVLDWGSNLSHPMVQENVRTDKYGNQIDHWADYDHSEGWKFQIFRIAGGASSGQVDFTEIMDYMDSYFGVSDSLTLTGCEVGTEIWGGSISATFNTCDLTINGETYSSGS
ncbi:hypothetical protein [Halopelagius longus]|uniref:Uncharacterized protein n=1 Tax=Halopelagius longus TaxID=1236180 RepID=A0A1H1FKX7_9EURY|nr:hypothetical protein [Halopelagius longus]RDI70056.1 hypothetical protein DWB78_15620 [Halopelagius longus]SDR01458.1 hypothetical protein SAMN05216278_3263 [Halopelagius longus]